MDRKVPFMVGEKYHIYTRGVDKQTVCRGDNDYQRLQLLLYLCNDSTPVKMRELFAKYKGEPLDRIFEYEERGETFTDIVAYAIMPTHFHLLLGEKKERGISKFMHKLMTAYSMYFNTKNDRSGPVFTRPFRSRHVDTDEYFRWVFSYILLNSLELERSNNHPYSSFSDYLMGRRPASRILEMSAAPSDLLSMDSLLSKLTEGRPR